jgi:hypothetical protein
MTSEWPCWNQFPVESRQLLIALLVEVSLRTSRDH